MGGPGVLMSRSTLRKVAPYLEYCLQNLYTTHEDVEVGRCIKKFVGVSCTWAFEVSFEKKLLMMRIIILLSNLSLICLLILRHNSHEISENFPLFSLTSWRIIVFFSNFAYLLDFSSIYYIILHYLKYH